MSKRFTKSAKDLEIMDDEVATLFDLNSRRDGSKKLLQKDIAEIIGRSEATVSVMHKKYLQNQPLHKQPQPREPTPVVQAIKSVLEESAAGPGQWDITVCMRKLKEKIQRPLNNKGEPVSRSFFYSTAKKLGFSSKKHSAVRKVDDAATNARRNAAAQSVVQSYEDRKPCLFVAADEMSILARTAGERGRGFSRIGAKSYSDSVNALQDLSYSVSAIVFVSQTNLEYVHLVEGTIDARDFDIGLREFMERRKTQGPMLLLLDNASIHRRQDLEHLKEEDEDFDYAFLPVNSPDTNPAESVINHLRSAITHFLRDSDIENPAAKWDALIEHISNLTLDAKTCFDTCNHAYGIIQRLRTMTYPHAVNSARRR